MRLAVVTAKTTGRVRAAGEPASVLMVLLAALLLPAVAGCRADAPAVEAGVTDAGTPPQLARSVAGMMPQLERLSGLDRLDELRVRTQSREDARAYVASRLEDELPPDVRDGIRRTYVALGLIPDTLDLDALLLDLYTEQVLGYYDPRTTTLYVVDDADPGALLPVLAHELVHALQDQHTNLDSLVARERGNDRQTAAHAAMEGHAMLVMFAFLAEQAAGREVDPAALPSPAVELGPALAAQNEQYPVFRRAPPIIQETLLFPYLRGADFMHQLWLSQQPQARYPAPIGPLLPQSTEQIKRPVERFIQRRDEPVELRFGDVAGRTVYENTLGQLEMAIWLDQHLGAGSRSAAHGWGGDRFVLVDVAGNDTQDAAATAVRAASPGSAETAATDVLYWLTVWDTPAEADRFADAARRIAARRGDRNMIIDRTELNGRAAVAVTDAARGVPVAAFPPAHIER
jgi:hypothetical protein